jgi:hydrogenase expression/formation protein HypC
MCLAVPGRLVAADARGDLERSGQVDFGGVTRAVSLAFVPEAKVGDFVLVHVGLALARVDEAEAAKVLAALAAIDAEEAS